METTISVVTQPSQSQRGYNLVFKFTILNQGEIFEITFRALLWPTVLTYIAEEIDIFGSRSRETDKTATGKSDHNFIKPFSRI